MKRIADVLLAGMALLVLSPIMAVLAVLIYVKEPGRPILFRQRRIGRYDEEFIMLKFRTMQVGTPDIPTDQLNDASVYLTDVGRWLRRTSLDELPQIWNVLTGSMSLVGPRPSLYNQEKLILLRQAAGVHVLRPGITGWAQVNGRDDISDEEKVRYDAEYLARRSLALDARILLLTVLRVVRAEGVKA